jgi:hypothetical protein
MLRMRVEMPRLRQPVNHGIQYAPGMTGSYVNGWTDGWMDGWMEETRATVALIAKSEYQQEEERRGTVTRDPAPRVTRNECLYKSENNASLDSSFPSSFSSSHGVYKQLDQTETLEWSLR